MWREWNMFTFPDLKIDPDLWPGLAAAGLLLFLIGAVTGAVLVCTTDHTEDRYAAQWLRH